MQQKTKRRPSSSLHASNDLKDAPESAAEKRDYIHVPIELRQALIECVFSSQASVRSIAIDLGIKYTTARHIISCTRKPGMWKASLQCATASAKHSRSEKKRSSASGHSSKWRATHPRTGLVGTYTQK